MCEAMGKVPTAPRAGSGARQQPGLRLPSASGPKCWRDGAAHMNTGATCFTPPQTPWSNTDISIYEHARDKKKKILSFLVKGVSKLEKH